jgi:hypothetical protein
VTAGSTNGQKNDVFSTEPHRVCGARSYYHHGRHEHLISSAPPAAAQNRDVDAIIVPTGRKAPAMEHAIRLAAKLRCKIVALCSKWSIATEVVKVAKQHRVEAIVIDATILPPGILPKFATGDLLAGTRYSRSSTDTSQKRNLGLLLASLYGWQRVVFLDDDIIIPDHEDLRLAVWLTEEYAGVGLAIDPNAPSFPDNSVVCHAYRDAGGDQGMFIGGGALAVGAETFDSFFPNIYNEDWFFLLGEYTLRPVTLTGRALQQPYDPFLHRRRAQGEELGDVLAEGLFWLLDAGMTIKDANNEYWTEALHRRLEFIAEVLKLVNEMKGDNRKRLTMLDSLQAAKGRCQLITPKLCTDFMSAWQRDRVLWRVHLATSRDSHGGAANVEKVLSSLGLAGQSLYVTTGV